jgi:hypothetical protein
MAASRPSRALVRQCVREHVGEHADALHERVRPFTLPLEAPQSEHMLDATCHTHRHREM